MNPLFPDEPKDAHAQPPNDVDHSPRRQKGEPAPTGPTGPAVELIRKKIDALYAEEPNAKEEIQEVEHAAGHRSKHQQFMYELSTSGKPLAQIQTEWHNYYTQLPDHEKLEVWQEFYEANARNPSAYTRAVQQHAHGKSGPEPEARQPEPAVTHHQPPPKPLALASQHPSSHHKPKRRRGMPRSFEDAKHRVLHKVRTHTQAQTKARQHLKSLLVGLSLGLLAVFILLFSFFNEVVIARLIQPGGSSGETPIILSSDSIAPGAEPELIIPKINVQLPVVYGLQSNSEEVVQRGLNDGVIHYPSTALPGQKGNGAYFGHSSNNIFNSGNYKFAFVLLRELVPGDIFYLTYDREVYVYRVYDKRVVSPDEVSVLGNAPGKVATAALITCDPPGTTINRLVVWGEQISPDPTGNSAAPTPSSSQPQELPAQGPTLWGRFWNWITGG